jgi:hypothetical protein
MLFLTLSALGGLCLLASFWIHHVNSRKYTKLPIVGPRRTLVDKLTWRFRSFQVRWGEEGYSTYMAPENRPKDFRPQAFLVPATYGYSTVLPPELLQEYSRMESNTVDFMAPPRDVCLLAQVVDSENQATID